MAAVHSILPPALTDAVEEVLRVAGVEHVAHGDDEPGCDDHAEHHGTVLRLVARDTVVARTIAERLGDRPARVIAGEHDYGLQLDGQLRMAGLRRSDDAGVIVLAGLAGQPEIDRARRLAPLPIIAFDGVQGEASRRPRAGRRDRAGLRARRGRCRRGAARRRDRRARTDAVRHAGARVR